MTMDAQFESTLQAHLERWGLTVDEAALARMWRHFELVVEKNRVMNLTRITDPARAAALHYADSLALLAWAKSADAKVRTVLDIGSGAGYPSVPLAVARPDWQVTAIDATRKKVDFLRQVIDEIGLSNLSVVQAHSEHWKPEHCFDVLTFRALAALGEGIATCGRHVARSGHLVAYKTARLDSSEVQSAKEAAAVHHLARRPIFEYELRCGDEIIPRALWVYQRK